MTSLDSQPTLAIRLDYKDRAKAKGLQSGLQALGAEAQINARKRFIRARVPAARALEACFLPGVQHASLYEDGQKKFGAYKMAWAAVLVLGLGVAGWAYWPEISQALAPFNPAPEPITKPELKPAEPVVAKPEPVSPKTTKPKSDTPAPAKPEPVKPAPEPAAPKTAKPKPDTPAPAKPEPVKPAPEPAAPKTAKPKPDTPAPAKPEPVKPAPEPATPKTAKPKPDTPAPAKPEPVKPAPEPVSPKTAKPKPDTPAPAKPEPVKPSPEPAAPKTAKPKPDTPAPAKPEPVKPAPEPATPKTAKPKPDTPAPAKPEPVKPAPEPTTPKTPKPKPDTPAPAKPEPVKPAKPRPLASLNVVKVPDYKLYQAGLDALKRDRKLNALVYWSKLAELQPKRNALRYKLGKLLAESGYKDEAIGHFKAILKNYPRHQGAQKALQQLSKGQ